MASSRVSLSDIDKAYTKALKNYSKNKNLAPILAVKQSYEEFLKRAIPADPIENVRIRIRLAICHGYLADIPLAEFRSQYNAVEKLIAANAPGYSRLKEDIARFEKSNMALFKPDNNADSIKLAEEEVRIYEYNFALSIRDRLEADPTHPERESWYNEAKTVLMNLESYYKRKKDQPSANMCKKARRDLEKAWKKANESELVLISPPHPVVSLPSPPSPIAHLESLPPALPENKRSIRKVQEVIPIVEIKEEKQSTVEKTPINFSELIKEMQEAIKIKPSSNKLKNKIKRLAIEKTKDAIDNLMKGDEAISKKLENQFYQLAAKLIINEFNELNEKVFAGVDAFSEVRDEKTPDEGVLKYRKKLPFSVVENHFSDRERLHFCIGKLHSIVLEREANALEIELNKKFPELPLSQVTLPERERNYYSLFTSTLPTLGEDSMLSSTVRDGLQFPSEDKKLGVEIANKFQKFFYLFIADHFKIQGQTVAAEDISEIINGFKAKLETKPSKVKIKKLPVKKPPDMSDAAFAVHTKAAFAAHKKAVLEKLEARQKDLEPMRLYMKNNPLAIVITLGEFLLRDKPKELNEFTRDTKELENSKNIARYLLRGLSIPESKQVLEKLGFSPEIVIELAQEKATLDFKDATARRETKLTSSDRESGLPTAVRKRKKESTPRLFQPPTSSDVEDTSFSPSEKKSRKNPKT